MRSSSNRSPVGMMQCWKQFLIFTVSLRLTQSFSPAGQPSHLRLHQQPKHIQRISTPLSLSSSDIINNDDSDDNDDSDKIMDVVICGAGPSGLLLAKEMASRNLKVVVVDPALDKPWPNNYGVWMDEADYFGYAHCCDKVWKQVGIVFDEDTPELVLTRPYGRIDRKKLKGQLVDECRDMGVEFAVAKATNVEHFDDQPSVVTTSSRPGGNNDNNNQQKKKQWKALLVTDATGFSREFVKHDVEFDPGYQVTYGARFRVKDLGPYKMERMVLMDYCERHLYEDTELTKSNVRFPSFVYAMPLAPDEIFLEETVLVSRPGASSRDLQARLKLRMKALGIEPLEVLEDERAAIPMGGMDPVVPQRTLGFGATASLVHPASGYMVARAMEVAPRVAQAVATEIQSLRQRNNNDGEVAVTNKDEMDKIAKAGWDAVWPTDERRQRDFMHFGFELLCRLDPQELRDFFTGFFRLPNGLWEHFLSWRLSGVGHIVMGITVWATCIPKRFMPSMLINSLPFLANRLAGPFVSRGDFAKIDTDSVYSDAWSGNATVWEPEAYYPYLEDLSKKDFGVDKKATSEEPAVTQELDLVK
ncbi:Capsanthin/capsorubin synthase, chromoplastic [Seminavis robusta]|uniref:lycopene beta-cyclase n=1 Tax=Seminavis robusta TaxID=568900 RepID=A0A9N8HN80_9STRA|nr:Capsanthin/capsorubin synthase, chromoplastic [Seminavis robusta]|eukprot:Sro1061_g236780.1 Capsanthin/capsorubin synthase, chromoplastic (587) ;mRNA; f:7335-9095